MSGGTIVTGIVVRMANDTKTGLIDTIVAAMTATPVAADMAITMAGVIAVIRRIGDDDSVGEPWLLNRPG